MSRLGDGGGARFSLWIGKVAGGAGGTVITITHTNGYMSVFAIEVTDTLAGTLGTSVSGSASTLLVTAAAPAADHLVVIFGGQDNTTQTNTMFASILTVGFAWGIVCGMVGYSYGGKVYGVTIPNTGTLMIAEIT